MVVVLNLTPVPRYDYRLGVPLAGTYREVFNSDAAVYGGSNLGTGDTPLSADEIPWMDRSHSLLLTLPPLAGLIFKYEQLDS